MAKSKDQAAPRTKRVYYSQVLHRVVQILGTFDSSSDGIRFSELTARLKLHKSTLYRLLEAMRQYDLIELDSKGSYHLGFKLFELGSLVTARIDVIQCAVEPLKALSIGTGETAQLCSLVGTQVLYLAKVNGKQTFYVPSTVGGRNPAYCTGVGKAILANLSPSAFEEYMRALVNEPMRRLTKRTVTSRERLERDLQRIRKQGYSVDDEEMSEGLRCVGAPVRDFTGHVVAGVSIAGPSVRVTKRTIPALASQVMDAAQRISEKLGHRDAERAKRDLEFVAKSF